MPTTSSSSPTSRSHPDSECKGTIPPTTTRRSARLEKKAKTYVDVGQGVRDLLDGMFSAIVVTTSGRPVVVVMGEVGGRD
jgi:hypothetical protein